MTNIPLKIIRDREVGFGSKSLLCQEGRGFILYLNKSYVIEASQRSWFPNV